MSTPPNLFAHFSTAKTLKKGTEDDAPGDGVLVVDALGGDVPNDDASDDDASEDDALDDDAPIKDAPNKDAPGDDASDDDASDGDAPDDDPPDDDAPDSDASPKVVVLDDDSTDDDASDDDDRPKCRDTDPQECALFARDKRQCFWKIDTPDGYSRCRNTCWDCDICECYPGVGVGTATHLVLECVKRCKISSTALPLRWSRRRSVLEQGKA